MWRSVPQMPVCVTATSTSFGPTAGTGVSGAQLKPGAASNFLIASMVFGIGIVLFLYLKPFSSIIEFRSSVYKKKVQYNGEQIVSRKGAKAQRRKERNDEIEKKT